MNATVSETLNLAADLIEERGWRTGGGWYGTSETGPLCLEGGIQAAMGVAEGPGYRCPAWQAVADYLGLDSGLWQWNDKLKFKLDDCGNPTRFHGDSLPAAMEHGKQRVIATLRAVAVIEAAREDAALLAEVGTA
jgi:hypothetical protein